MPSAMNASNVPFSSSWRLFPKPGTMGRVDVHYTQIPLTDRFVFGDHLRDIVNLKELQELALFDQEWPHAFAKGTSLADISSKIIEPALSEFIKSENTTALTSITFRFKMAKDVITAAILFIKRDNSIDARITLYAHTQNPPIRIANLLKSLLLDDPCIKKYSSEICVTGVVTAAIYLAILFRKKLF